MLSHYIKFLFSETNCRSLIILTYNSYILLGFVLTDVYLHAQPTHIQIQVLNYVNYQLDANNAFVLYNYTIY